MNQKVSANNSTVDVDDLWHRFCSTGDSSSRDQLILFYAPLVKRVASRLGISESALLDYQDRISHGVLGLIEAVDRFDPERGFTFETYATPRIRGAILDGLREMDHASRSVRQQAGKIERSIAELRNRLGRIPTDEEVAESLDMNLDNYHQVVCQANIVFLSLDSPLSDLQDGGDTMTLSEALEDPAGGDAAVEVEERDLRATLEAAIRELDKREQLVLSLYYYDELTVREVGEVLDLSATRVSQLLGRAVMNLRARLLYGQERAPAIELPGHKMPAMSGKLARP
jgi:RNA polymerase sigma factor FliA